MKWLKDKGWWFMGGVLLLQFLWQGWQWGTNMERRVAEIEARLGNLTGAVLQVHPELGQRAPPARSEPPEQDLGGRPR
jgi:hypothetical protein